MNKPRQAARHGLLAATFLLSYFVLSLPQFTYITQIGFAAWYPAIGLVIALLLGVSPCYGFLVAAADMIAGHFIYGQPLFSYQGLAGAVGSAAWYTLAAQVLRKRLVIDPELRRRHDVVRYLVFCAIAAIASTVTGVTCLLADHALGAHEYWSSMVEWFIGDGIGVVGVAPFLLIYVLPWVRRKVFPDAHAVQELNPVKAPSLSTKTIASATAQALALVGAVWIMFDPQFGNDKFFLGLVPIVWIAMRFGIRGSAVGALALNFGVVVAMRIFPPNSSQLRTVGLLMLVVSSVGLFVGASVTERDRFSSELAERTSYLDSVIENSPFGIVVLDDGGRVKFANRSFEALTLCPQSELTGSHLDSLFTPEARSDMPEEWYARVVAGQTIHHTFTWGRDDGNVLDLQMDAVPLTIQGRLRGAYVIYKDVSEQIRMAEAKRKHTESLNRLVCELEFRTSQMAILNEMGSLLECCATLGEAAEVTSHSVRKLFPEAVSGGFFMSESSSRPLDALALWGNVDASNPTMFGPQECWALRKGRPHWSVEGQGVVCQHIKPGPNGFLCLPLSAKEGCMGILELEFAPEEGWQNDGPESHQRRQEGLGITVAGQLEHSIASLKLRETLRDQSIRDPLTGLYNRRFMVESLERELLRAERNGQKLSILFMDLDHFKRFNDTFGHEAGDFVLRTMAGVFRDFFRGNDLICRFGGEEFAILLPDCAPHDATARADALRDRVRSTTLRYQGHVLHTVTLSIGVAAFPDSGTTVTEILKVADDCLYRSKSSGRDATTAARALAAGG